MQVPFYSSSKTLLNDRLRVTDFITTWPGVTAIFAITYLGFCALIHYLGGNQMKICMVGSGAFAKKHLDGLARIKDVQVVSLHGRTAETTKAVAEKYGIP